MSLRSAVIAQFREPSGTLGRLAGWTMAHRPSNRQRNRRTIELLELAPSDTVLEIGYGPGLAIELVARRLRGGKVFGVDHSSTMYRQAVRRNAAAIAAGRVDLRVDNILSLTRTLPLADKIYSVNVVQFWPEPERVFAALKGLLKPGGRIATTFMPRVGNDRSDQARSRAQRLERLMQETGFDHHETHWMNLSTPAFCIVASTPA